MIKLKTVDDDIILGISAKNVAKMRKGENLFFLGEDLGIDTDVQLLIGTKAIGVEGRKCFVMSFNEEQLQNLIKGGYRKVEKQPHMPYSLLVFYSETEEGLQELVNEAIGNGRKAIPLKRGESYTERLVDGKIVRKHEDASAIFRNGKVWQM